MPPIRHILVARDFSPASERALQTALALAERADATLHLVHAEVLHADPYGTPPDAAGPVDKARERMKETVEHDRDERARFDPGSVRIEHAVVRDVAAAPALVRYAEEHDIDLIVMGTHGRTGLRRLLLGSVAEEVVRWAPCSVLTVRADAAEPGDARSVLAAVDFSPSSEAAVQEAGRLAHLLGAQLNLLHVVETVSVPSFYGSSSTFTPELAEGVLGELRAFAHRVLADEVERGLDVDVHVGIGPPSRVIVEEADRLDAAPVVTGKRGLSGLEHLLLGSVAERVLRTSARSVLVAKTGARAVSDGERNEAHPALAALRTGSSAAAPSATA